MFIILNIRYIIKFIFFVSALINLASPIKAINIFANNSNANSQTIDNNLLKRLLHENIKLPKQESLKKYKKNYIRSSKGEIFKNAKNDFSLLIANLSSRKKEIEIQSDIQSEKNNILNAKGNVLVSYKGNILRSDSLIYDKTNKTLSATGNVSLRIGKQLLKMVSFQYNFKNKKGYLIDVKGLIKTDNLLDDLFSNFESTDIKKNLLLKEIKKNKVRNTPNYVDNWVFFTDKIEIHDKNWKSKKAIFTNDLLELKQVKIEINSLEAIVSKEKLRFKSSLNRLILDEKIAIPFWVGDRTLTKEINYANKWNFGFENIDKDGFFIGRKLNSVNLFDDFVFDIEPQFLIQRSLQGYTKSFVNEGDSITGSKAKRNTTLKDYFALNSKIKGKIKNWNLEIDQQINSFDFGKFSDAIRFSTNLNKDITFLDSNWNKSFYGVYRDRVWNGSIGETEIYLGYGSKLKKQNTWEVNGISKTERLSFGIADFKAEALNSLNLVNSTKANFFYSLDQKFPIIVNEPSDNFIDSSFKYISEPIKKGLAINTKLELLYSLYEKGGSQQYLGLGVGPEFIFGNFKKESFDYTRISVLPFYKIKSGNSIFKFDQVSDKFTIDIALDQQLIGPLILKNSATLNLDSASKDYGDFINSKISLNWKRRSYEFGIFYQPHNEVGGIAFTLFGFE